MLSSYLDRSTVRSVSLLVAFGGLALLTACKGGGSKSTPDAGDDDTKPASCAPIGKSVACTGRGGCAGSQVCEESGRYGTCDCGDGPITGTPGGGVVADAGPGAAPDGGGMMTAACGAPCTMDSDCGGGFCVKERPVTAQLSGFGEVKFERFPGGFCSQKPLAAYENPASCDPDAPQAAQGCGACGVCTFEVFSNALATACREKCTPSATDNGCSRDGYTCSFNSGGCIDAECKIDAQCRAYSEDSDDDGVSDAFVYDANSMAKCNLTTGRCQVTGKAGAQAGDPCMRDDDCEADGYCLTESSGEFDVPFRGGYCVKRGCRVAGLECAGEGVCGAPRAWFEEESLGVVCTHACEQGKDAMADQLGVAGHGAGCRQGYMCMWGGKASDPKGSCMPGVYNAVTINNIGAACKKHEECYSPFGHGRCATMGTDLATASFCALFDCGSPGLPTDICGTGNVCVRLPDGVSSCLHACKDASECSAGLACTTVGTNTKACVFGCESNAECKTGETCSRNTGACVKTAM